MQKISEEESRKEAIALATHSSLSNALRIIGTVDPRGNVGKYTYKKNGFKISVMKDVFDGTPVADSLNMTYEGNGDWKAELHKIYLNEKEKGNI